MFFQLGSFNGFILFDWEKECRGIKRKKEKSCYADVRRGIPEIRREIKKEKSCYAKVRREIAEIRKGIERKRRKKRIVKQRNMYKLPGNSLRPFAYPLRICAYLCVTACLSRY